MTRSSQPLIAVIVALGLAVPAVAHAQRTSAGSSSSGTAESRGGASSGSSGGGGSSTAGSVGPSGGSSGSAVPRGPSGSPNGTPQGPTRDRNGRPAVGTASTRMLGTVTGLPGPTFGPWGRYFPWYSTGFGWNYGFFQYDPYYGYGYGYGVGPWYDPFYYDPFNPFGYGYGVFRYGGYGYYAPTSDYGGSSSSSTTHLTGSIRLKVSPDTAKVYIDGVLAGTAGDFDGLVNHHLTLEGGTHQFELRADGYETYHATLTVDPGKTMTERVSMKKGK